MRWRSVFCWPCWDLLIEGQPKRIAIIVGGMLLGAVVLAHHHVSIVAAVLMTAIGAWCWTRDRARLQLVLAITVVGLAVASSTVMRMLLRPARSAAPGS